jgi:hypothetical protein
VGAEVDDMKLSRLASLMCTATRDVASRGHTAMSFKVLSSLIPGFSSEQRAGSLSVQSKIRRNLAKGRNGRSQPKMFRRSNPNHHSSERLPHTSRIGQSQETGPFALLSEAADDTREHRCAACVLSALLEIHGAVWATLEMSMS